MTPGPLDTYLRALARALHARGHAAARIVAEAREHLIDAVEDGMRRGLARDDAERDAIQRFGPPDLVAAQAPLVRSRPMSRLTAALDTIVVHWRWITAATAAAALLCGVAAYYLLPKAYESQSVIAVTSERWPEGLTPISEAVLSDPHLASMARDFGLGDAMPELRRRIGVEILETPNHVRIGFRSADPRQAQRVTERLASLFIQENFQQATAGRQTGAVFKVVQPPTFPQQADTPGLEKAAASGAFSGLALSIAALVWRKAPPA